MQAPASAKIPTEALPRSDAGRLDWLRLARSRRVGPATFIRLIREFGSAEAALEALPRIAAEAGAGSYAPCTRAEAAAEIEAGLAAGAQPLLLGAADYPAALAMIGDPPPLLWALGEAALALRPGVALVGARNASALGARMASRLAAELGAAGLVVVSGLARGIDAAAHRAGLATGTIAVQAGGIDVVYPRRMPRSPPRSPRAACGSRSCRRAMRRGHRISPAATASSPGWCSASWWSRGRCAPEA